MPAADGGLHNFAFASRYIQVAPLLGDYEYAVVRAVDPARPPRRCRPASAIIPVAALLLVGLLAAMAGTDHGPSAAMAADRLSLVADRVPPSSAEGKKGSVLDAAESALSTMGSAVTSAFGGVTSRFGDGKRGEQLSPGGLPAPPSPGEASAPSPSAPHPLTAEALSWTNIDGTDPIWDPWAAYGAHVDKGALPPRMATTTTRPPAAGDMSSTLYCFIVMLAGTYEQGLVEMQLSRGISAFACEAHSILSSSVFDIKAKGPGGEQRVVTTANIGSMKCRMGGKWNLALNSEIFVRAWKVVFALGIYKQHGWTVKIDPDAVFLPSRLKDRVLGANSSFGVYLNNCNQGLHGPIEILSHGGMYMFDEGIMDCESKLSWEFGTWGEDVFLRHCMRWLKVKQIEDWRLLSEDHCFNANPAKDGCSSGKVAFHPFKTTDSYIHCLEGALRTPAR